MTVLLKLECGHELRAQREREEVFCMKCDAVLPVAGVSVLG